MKVEQWKSERVYCLQYKSSVAFLMNESINECNLRYYRERPSSKPDADGGMKPTNRRRTIGSKPLYGNVPSYNR